jgi:hypothetical protein
VPVIPGNHDIWGGWILGQGPAAGNAPAGAFPAFFGVPAPGAIPNPAVPGPFPYQLQLTALPLLAALPYPVCLYGLDSTQVHLTAHPRYHNFLAQGYVDPAQLTALAALVGAENPVARVRIAAIHNPLAYVPRTHGLVNLPQVVQTLKSLGFHLVLCGHLHRGYVQIIPPISHPVVVPHPPRPVGVLSVGTATQAVRLTRWEKALLKNGYSALTSNATKAEWKRAAARCNEFRTYDLELRDDPPYLVVTVQRYRYDPRFLKFGQIPRPYSFPLSL